MGIGPLFQNSEMGIGPSVFQIGHWSLISNQGVAPITGLQHRFSQTTRVCTGRGPRAEGHRALSCQYGRRPYNRPWPPGRGVQQRESVWRCAWTVGKFLLSFMVKRNLGYPYRRPPATRSDKLCSSDWPGADPRTEVLLPEMPEAPEEDVEVISLGAACALTGVVPHPTIQRFWPLPFCECSRGRCF